MAYDATVVLDDTGKYVNYKLEFDQKKAGAKHEVRNETNMPWCPLTPLNDTWGRVMRISPV